MLLFGRQARSGREGETRLGRETVHMGFRLYSYLRLIGDFNMVVSIGLEYLIITTGYCCIVVVSLLEFNVCACCYQNESVSGA